MEGLANLPRSPALFPMALDFGRARILFVPMDKASYRASSFLDERAAIAGERQGQWVPLTDVREAMQPGDGKRPLHFIFHSGHVGSTLLSRLLDETGTVLPLREPLPLRTLAEAFDTGEPAFEPCLETMLRLWERGFADTETVVLKATSTAQRLAPQILAARPEARAVMLNVSAQSYLATMFAAANSAADMNAHGPERLFRLGRMGIAIRQPRTLPELAAMSWLAESLTQLLVRSAFGARIMAVDFDGMLQELERTLRGILSHFEIGDAGAKAAALSNSAILSRYSKAQEHAYSPAQRAESLDVARAQYGPQIREAMGWLAAIADKDARVASLL